MILFTDVSVNPKTKIGYGAYLMVAEETFSLDLLKTRVDEIDRLFTRVDRAARNALRADNQ